MTKFDLILNSGFRKEDFNVESSQRTASYGKSSHGPLGNLILGTKTMYNGYEYLICPKLTFFRDFFFYFWSRNHKIPYIKPISWITSTCTQINSIFRRTFHALFFVNNVFKKSI